MIFTYLIPSGAKIDIYESLLIGTYKSWLGASWDQEAAIGKS